jgi:hypothetical protein
VSDPDLALPSSEEVLGQMAYLADELEAQQQIVGLIPEPIWDARPFAESPTLREMYQAMLDRECVEYREALGLPALGVGPASTPGDLLSNLTAARSATVTVLRDGLTPDQVAYCYQITQNDAGSLREVGVRLSEAQLVKPRVRRL